MLYVITATGLSIGIGALIFKFLLKTHNLEG
jgi:hypothetical protein